jgi:AsmA protein
MSGILDNPDAAYAKLKEMGKGLFGANGGGLGGLLGNLGGNLGGTTGNNPSGSGPSNGNDADGNGQGGVLGGRLGETLGNMIQQGLGGRSRGRSIPPIGGTPDAQTTQPQPAAPPDAQGDNTSQPPNQDSQPMNDVLRQLFNRSQN